MAALRLFLKFCALTRLHKGKLLAASSFGLFAANLSHHAVPEQTFRKLYQAWSKGEPAPLSDDLRALFQDVLSEARCGSPDGYTPFAGYGFHPVSAGVPWLPGGCSVGIPANYNADGAAGIADRMLVINGQEVDWRSDAGAKLRDALTFSTDAQKFSLTREAVHARSGGPVIQASVGPACLVAVCVTSVGMKQLLGLYAGPMLLRGAFNLLAVSLGFAAYLMCDDSVTHWLDYRADRRAATVSESYARGGLEFYEKILARNRVLRGLMGARGEATYAPNGNLFPRHKLRLKHAPYTSRRERIRQALEAAHS